MADRYGFRKILAYTKARTTEGPKRGESVFGLAAGVHKDVAFTALTEKMRQEAREELALRSKAFVIGLMDAASKGHLRAAQMLFELAQPAEGNTETAREEQLLAMMEEMKQLATEAEWNDGKQTNSDCCVTGTNG